MFHKNKGSQVLSAADIRLERLTKRRNELDTYRLAHRNVLSGVGQQTGLFVSSVHLYPVFIAAGHQQEFPVGGDVEVAMSSPEIAMSRIRMIYGMKGYSSIFTSAMPTLSSPSTMRRSLAVVPLKV